MSAALITQGFDVVGLDPDPEVVQVAVEAGVRAVEASFLDYGSEELFDVVLFSRSLHHVPDLAAAVDRACALLQPGGLVVADEFALEQTNSATAAWFYGMLDLLESTGLNEEHGHALQASVDEEPLTRWQHDHAEVPPLHTGAAMLEELSRRLAIEHTERTAYLFGYLCRRLERSDRGYEVAKAVLQLERVLTRGRCRSYRAPTHGAFAAPRVSFGLDGNQPVIPASVLVGCRLRLALVTQGVESSFVSS